MGKRLLENSISLGQYVCLEGALACAFAETLLSSYSITQSSFLFPLHFIPAHSHFCFPPLYSCSGLCWRSSNKIIILSATKLLGVCSLYIPFLLPSFLWSHPHMWLWSPNLFGTMRSALTLYQAPYHVDLFWTCKGMQASLQVFCRKLPLDIHSRKLLFHDSSNPSVASNKDEPIPMQ